MGTFKYINQYVNNYQPERIFSFQITVILLVILLTEFFQKWTIDTLLTGGWKPKSVKKEVKHIYT